MAKVSSKSTERAPRGIFLGRKSWLIAGSDRGGERAAVMYTLIGTAKLNDVDPKPGAPTSSPLSDGVNRFMKQRKEGLQCSAYRVIHPITCYIARHAL